MVTFGGMVDLDVEWRGGVVEGCEELCGGYVLESTCSVL